MIKKHNFTDVSLNDLVQDGSLSGLAPHSQSLAERDPRAAEREMNYDMDCGQDCYN